MEAWRYGLSADMAWVVKATAGTEGCTGGKVEAHRTLGEEARVERRYSLTSLAGTAKRFGQAVRGH